MDDPLDNDLRNRIREVFENFEDASADEGWLLLREKYPEKAKRRPAAWLWWSSVAAVLLLFLGILWFKYTPADTQQITNIKKKPASNSAPKTIEQKKDNILKDTAILSEPQQAIADNNKEAIPAIKRSDVSSAQQQIAKQPSPAVRKSAVSSFQQQIAKQPSVPSAGLNNIVKPNPALTDRSVIKVDSTMQIVAAVQPKIQPKAPDLIAATPVIKDKVKIDTSSKQPAKSMAATTVPGIDMQQITKTNSAILTDHGDQKSNKKSENNDKAVRFGVYAATYFNYAKGSNNQLNLGAGFTSDIKLSKNLKFSTGVAIAQNTLNYNSQIPLAAPAALAAASAYGSSKDTYLAAAAVPSIKTYNANLVGLDVPLNLKYVFDPQNSDTYISAGLSSGTFINEKYTYSYNYSAPFSATGNQVQDQTTNQSFNSFYFAKTLNVSFGVGYPLGKNRLIIEPFLKYPLSGLGSQDIRFGAGGLNLKFNFSKK
ncbi:MAG TPA: hypothetical protein VK668_11645 [Mucilaginibacter sp.]|nr:hypothetical protein [Mucilaginibacter sp.]